MTQITLSDDQTRLLADADDEWIAEALRRKEKYEREGGQGYTTREVLEHLRSLMPE